MDGSPFRAIGDSGDVYEGDVLSDRDGRCRPSGWAAGEQEFSGKGVSACHLRRVLSENPRRSVVIEEAAIRLDRRSAVPGQPLAR
jgi:hypothetical protein